MEEGITLGYSKELALLTFWPKKVVPAIATRDDGSALCGSVMFVPLAGGLHVVVVPRVWSLGKKPETSLPNHMYVVG
jgi:hypothetical protein